MKKGFERIARLFVCALCILVGTIGAVKITASAAVSVGEQVLIEDDCNDFTNVDKSHSDMDTLRIENERIARNHDAEDSQGPMGTDDSRKKYMPSALVYKVYGDIKRFEVDTVLYFWKAGYESAVKPESKKYFFFEVEMHVSTDAENWQLVECDYTVEKPKDEDLFPADEWATVRYFNKEELPAGMRYLKIYLIGQIGLCDEGGTVFDYESTGNLSADPWYTFQNISNYYNSWAPFVERVGIYADESTVIEEAIHSLRIDNKEKTLRKGEQYSIALMATLSTDPAWQPVTDFSEFSVVIKEGAEYVDVDPTSGMLTVVDGYAAKNGKVILYVEKDGVYTDDLTISLILPVESVVLSAETTTVRVGSDYIPLGIGITPQEATNVTPEWVVKDGEGKEVSDAIDVTAEGMLKGVKAGTFTVSAIIDGVQSNAVQIIVQERTKATIEGEFKLRVGDKIKLEIVITPDSAKTLPVVWSIVEEDGIAVIENGELKALAIGICTLRATVDGQTVEKYVEIRSAAAKEKSCSGSIISPITAVSVVAFAALTAIKKRKSEEGK